MSQNRSTLAVGEPVGVTDPDPAMDRVGEREEVVEREGVMVGDKVRVALGDWEPLLV